MIVVPFDHTIDEASYLKAVSKNSRNGATRQPVKEIHWLESLGASLLFLALFAVAGCLLWWSVQELHTGLSSIDSTSFVRLANGR